jgi:predicted membrane-bound spermidine synthase
MSDREMLAKPDDSRVPFRLAQTLAFVSAAAAGAHELVWSRLLGRAVGNTALGVSLTLAVFMAGTGMGSFLAARSAMLRSTPVRAYARAEVLIAVGAALTVWYCLFASPPSRHLDNDGLGLALDVVITGMVTLPSALAIGMTYPLLAAGATGTGAARGVYEAGLWGAVFGILTAALIVAPAWGFEITAYLAAATNITVAAIVWFRDGRRVGGRKILSLAPPNNWREGAVRFAAMGALGVSAQVVWNRCVLPYAGVASFAFAAIVIAYLLGQGIGFRAQRLTRSKWEHAPDVAVVLTGPIAIVLLGLAPYVATLTPSRDGAVLSWTMGVLCAVFAIVLVPSALVGFAQAQVLDRFDGPSAGADAGVVVGVGAVVSALAAFAVGSFILPAVGPRWSLSLLGAVSLLVVSRRDVQAFGTIGLIGAMAWSPGPTWFLGAEYDRAPILFAEHGVQDTTAVITVDRPVEPRTRRLVSNGMSYSGDSIFAQRYMRLLAHLPALRAMHRNRALLICVGTGSTLDALRLHRFESIDAVDISESVLQTLPLFERTNHDVLNDPSVRFVIDDGARYVRRVSTLYDVITLEPPPPRAPGTTALYSRDFYEAARERLADGGVIAQWLPLHGMSTREVESLAATFQSVFPDATLHLVERNEAVMLSRGTGGSATMSDAVRADLSVLGFRTTPPFEDTLLGDLEAFLDDSSSVVLSDAWPFPEFSPLGGADAAVSPLTEFMERIREHGSATQGSSASLLADIAPAFVRGTMGSPEPGDVETVRRGMAAWLARDPGDPYVQHAFGFGPLLESRLEALTDLTQEDRLRVQRSMAANRARAMRASE